MTLVVVVLVVATTGSVLISNTAEGEWEALRERLFPAH